MNAVSQLTDVLIKSMKEHPEEWGDLDWTWWTWNEKLGIYLELQPATLEYIKVREISGPFAKGEGNILLYIRWWNCFRLRQQWNKLRQKKVNPRPAKKKSNDDRAAELLLDILKK